MKKKFQKFTFNNQAFIRKQKKFFEKHLEIKKKYLPLHSQTETKRAPKRKRNGEKKSSLKILETVLNKVRNLLGRKSNYSF
jgi:hypothetical protein